MKQQLVFKCALCGNQLEEKTKRRLRSDSIYCSARCKNTANNERRRIRRMEQRLYDMLTDLYLSMKNEALAHDAKEVGINLGNELANVLSTCGWEG
jgi:predicted nucleic acid-binding Zn ribbon protein